MSGECLEQVIMRISAQSGFRLEGGGAGLGWLGRGRVDSKLRYCTVG